VNLGWSTGEDVQLPASQQDCEGVAERAVERRRQQAVEHRRDPRMSCVGHDLHALELESGFVEQVRDQARSPCVEVMIPVEFVSDASLHAPVVDGQPEVQVAHWLQDSPPLPKLDKRRERVLEAVVRDHDVGDVRLHLRCSLIRLETTACCVRTSERADFNADLAAAGKQREQSTVATAKVENCLVGRDASVELPELEHRPLIRGAVLPLGVGAAILPAMTQAPLLRMHQPSMTGVGLPGMGGLARVARPAQIRFRALSRYDGR
jgi:hypothetical protein